jgi:uncharacterized SAM-binding protein YcdF (DUF218 family)
LLFALFLLVWCAGLVRFITLIPQTPSTDTTHTDAIVVLTGGGGRLEHGFELLAQGRANRMFISGVEDGLTLASLLRKKDYRQYAAHIAPGSVELGYKARSTVGNALEVAEWVVKNHITSIRIVTANYHIPRSLYELHHTLPDVTVIPDPVFPLRGGAAGWQFSLTGVRLIVSEYHKYVASICMHHLRS